MKLRTFVILVSAVLGTATFATAAQINWGSPVDSVFRDSFGVPLDDTYAVQLGYFASVLGETDPFIPTAANAADWAAHWKIFDQAAFDPDAGYFTSSALLKADGSSSSPSASLGVDFSNKDAYLWIHNSTAPGPESEWFLGRSGPWTTPNKPLTCCENLPVLNWSVSDFTTNNDVPVYGKQGQISGEGEHTVDGNYTLQTFTFVPEPSSALLVGLGSLIVVLRRRRTGNS